MGDYTLNLALARQLFVGPEIAMAPASELAAYPWTRPILDSLPADVGQVLDANVKDLEEQARTLVSARALARAQRFVVSAPSISEFARVDRVEGLAPGFGLGRGLGPEMSVTAQGRYGLDDHTAKGMGTLRWEDPSGLSLRVFAMSDFRDLGDQQERSTLVNSLAAQEFGSDDSDPYGVRGYGLSASTHPADNTAVTLEGTYERDVPLGVNAVPASGSYEPTVLVLPTLAVRVSLRMDRAMAPWFWGTTLGVDAEARVLRPIGAAVVLAGTDARVALRIRSRERRRCIAHRMAKLSRWRVPFRSV